MRVQRLQNYLKCSSTRLTGRAFQKKNAFATAGETVAGEIHLGGEPMREETAHRFDIVKADVGDVVSDKPRAKQATLKRDRLGTQRFDGKFFRER